MLLYCLSPLFVLQSDQAQRAYSIHSEFCILNSELNFTETGECFLPERIYVTVSSDFDPTGYMQPRAITWPDGRVFPIEDVRSFRPAGENRLLDCYTIVIRGKEKRLYFERAGNPLACCLGRWYVDPSK